MYVNAHGQDESLSTFPSEAPLKKMVHFPAWFCLPNPFSAVSTLRLMPEILISLTYGTTTFLHSMIGMKGERGGGGRENVF